MENPKLQEIKKIVRENYLKRERNENQLRFFNKASLVIGLLTLIIEVFFISTHTGDKSLPVADTDIVMTIVFVLITSTGVGMAIAGILLGFHMLLYVDPVIEDGKSNILVKAYLSENIAEDKDAVVKLKKELQEKEKSIKTHEELLLSFNES